MIRQPSVQESLKRFREDFKGDPGYTPKLGVDYFTQEQIQSVIEYVISQVKDGADGVDGKDGQDGKDGAQGPRGKAGDTPILGVHYWTQEHQTKIIAEAIKQLEPKIPTLERFLSKIPKQKAIKYSEIEDAPDPESVPKLIEFLKRGGFRGGAGTSAGGGGTVTPVTPTGTVNAVNTVFGVASQPKWVIADGITYFEGLGYSYSAPNITLDIPPSTFIRAVL